MTPAPVPPLAEALPRPVRRSRAPLVAGLAIAGVLVAGGVVLTLVLVLRRGPALPVAWNQLPPDLSVVRSHDRAALRAFNLGLKKEDIPDESTWSWVAANLCGAPTDLFADLLSSMHGESSKRLARAFEDPSGLGKALACGKELSAKIPASYRVTFVTTASRKHRETVTLLPLDRKDLPDGFPKLQRAPDPDHLELTRCVEAPEDERKKARSDKESGKDRLPCLQGVARIEGTNVFLAGSLDALEAFGEGYRPTGKQRGDKLLEELFGAHAAAIVRVGTGDDDAALGALPGSIDDKELRKTLQKTMRDVDAWGISTNIHDDDDGWGTDTFEFRCHSDATAKDVAEAVERWMKAAAEKAHDEEEKEPKAEEREADERRDWWSAKRGVVARAYRDATIVTDGATVRMVVAYDPDERARRAWSTLEKWNAARAKKAALVVDGLIDGKTPSDEDLEDLASGLAEARGAAH
ncbi:MAG: hypothetical protein U0414_29705 [Polyangiaceae bacterium]